MKINNVPGNLFGLRGNMKKYENQARKNTPFTPKLTRNNVFHAYLFIVIYHI